MRVESKENATTLEYTAELFQFNRSKMDEVIGEYHGEVLARLLEVAGDSSLPHYYAAMYDTQRGNYEAAIDNLAAGNRAPNNTSMIGFPFENILSDMQSGKPLPDKTISGSILSDGQMLAMPNYVQLKRMVKLLVADAISRDDRAALDEIHTYACRLGSARGGDTLAALVGSILAGLVEAEFNVNFNSPLNPEQRNNISTLGSIRGQVRNQIRAMSVNSPMLNPLTMPLLPRANWFIEGALSGGRSVSIKNMEAFHDYGVIEQSTLASVNQIFAQMETFNYNTMEFE